jgi:hypothetical protein
MMKSENLEKPTENQQIANNAAKQSQDSQRLEDDKVEVLGTAQTSEAQNDSQLDETQLRASLESMLEVNLALHKAITNNDETEIEKVINKALEKGVLRVDINNVIRDCLDEYNVNLRKAVAANNKSEFMLVCAQALIHFGKFPSVNSQDLREIVADEEELTIGFHEILHDTPLMIAVRAKSLDMLRLLLQFGADPKPVNANGKNAMMLAAQNGDIESVRFLINYGANYLQKNLQNNFTARDYAKEAGVEKEYDKMLEEVLIDNNRISFKRIRVNPTSYDVNPYVNFLDKMQSFLDKKISLVALLEKNKEKDFLDQQLFHLVRDFEVAGEDFVFELDHLKGSNYRKFFDNYNLLYANFTEIRKFNNDFVNRELARVELRLNKINIHVDEGDLYIHEFKQAEALFGNKLQLIEKNAEILDPDNYAFGADVKAAVDVKQLQDSRTNRKISFSMDDITPEHKAIFKEEVCYGRIAIGKERLIGINRERFIESYEEVAIANKDVAVGTKEYSEEAKELIKQEDQEKAIIIKFMDCLLVVAEKEFAGASFVEFLEKSLEKKSDIFANHYTKLRKLLDDLAEVEIESAFKVLKDTVEYLENESCVQALESEELEYQKNEKHLDDKVKQLQLEVNRSNLRIKRLAKSFDLDWSDFDKAIKLAESEIENSKSESAKQSLGESKISLNAQIFEKEKILARIIFLKKERDIMLKMLEESSHDKVNKKLHKHAHKIFLKISKEDEKLIEGIEKRQSKLQKQYRSIVEERRYMIDDIRDLFDKLFQIYKSNKSTLLRDAIEGYIALEKG